MKIAQKKLVDKPLGWNTSEAAHIADTAEAAGVVLMVGFMKRYSPVYMKLKEWITEEMLGAARSFEARFTVDSTPFCKNDEEFMKLAAIHLHEEFLGYLLDAEDDDSLNGRQ